MSKIFIKMLSEDALNFLIKNIDIITKKIQNNPTNKWIYDEFPQPMFVEKKIKIEDFTLKNNPNSIDKIADLENSIKIYESCSSIPRYILTDQRFWLWFHFEKFYDVVKDMMEIKSSSTVIDHWMHRSGKRRGLMYGVLSRCYFRVELSIDNSSKDKYYLTKWIIENPQRFREFTWRTYSSQKHIILGILRGEKRAVEEKGEKTSIYAIIAKKISFVGSVRLLDGISREDIEEITYQQALKLLN